MAENKTRQTTASVKDFIDAVPHEQRRVDSKAVLKMMKSVSGKLPKMWGPTIIGFGLSYYKLANGKDAGICKIGFSPRAQSLAFYLGNFEGRPGLLKELGKHKVGGGGCLYINKLDDVDLRILEKMIERAYIH